MTPKKTPEKSYVQTLGEAVSTKIAHSGKQVFDKVAETLATKEIESRVSLILQHYTEVDNLSKEMRRVKPDQISLDSEGKEVSATFSKGQFEKFKKLADRKEKVEKAIEEALDNNNFDPLKKLGDNKDDKQPQG